jgi:3'-5' exoribonuclease-like protein
VKYFYDTEFIEDGRTIDLISIGIVAEDGREYYAVNEKAPWRRIKRHEWLMANVVPGLRRGHGDWRLHMPKRWIIDFGDPCVKPKWKIAAQVQDFLLAENDELELWAWYAAYDHVALCQLWGTMMDLPKGIPMYTRDLKQECDRLGNPALPEQSSGVHNALADAKHNFVRARALGVVS